MRRRTAALVPAALERLPQTTRYASIPGMRQNSKNGGINPPAYRQDAELLQEFEELCEQLQRFRLRLASITKGLERRQSSFAPTSIDVRSYQIARSDREKHLGSGIFGEPGWDILLELYARYLDQQRVGISELGTKVLLPDATLLRWLEKLQDRGLVERVLHPTDARRVFVVLTTEGAARMQSWFKSTSSLLKASAAESNEHQD